MNYKLGTFKVDDRVTITDFGSPYNGAKGTVLSVDYIDNLVILLDNPITINGNKAIIVNKGFVQFLNAQLLRDNLFSEKYWELEKVADSFHKDVISILNRDRPQVSDYTLEKVDLILKLMKQTIETHNKSIKELSYKK